MTLCVKITEHLNEHNMLAVLCCAYSLSCVQLCDASGSSVHSPGKNTGPGCRALLQGIFPTQGSNPGLPYCRRILYRLSH